MRQTMMIAIFFTEGGKQLAEKLISHYPELELYTIEALSDEKAEEFEKPLSFFVSNNWRESKAIIFISALGIAVRAIAPSVGSKLDDPAVICIDEKGTFVISLLSGHIGGANALAREIAEKIGALPIITTSTDIQGKPCLEELANSHSLVIESPEDIKKVNSAITNGRRVAVISDYLEKVEGFPLYTIDSELKDYDLFIMVTSRLSDINAEHVYLRPKNLVAGIGFTTRVTAEEMTEKIKMRFEERGLSIKSLTALATVDFKADSRELKKAAEILNIEVISIPVKEIRNVENKFKVSEFVRTSIGLGSVAEPCAHIASKKGEMIINKTSLGGITLAVAEVKRSITHD